MKWEFEFVIKEEKKHFVLFFPLFLEFFTMAQHSLPTLWVFVFWVFFFLQRIRITFELKPSMNVFSVL